jgi:hypothetical protein
VSRLVRRAPALLLALSACFNPAGVDTSGEPGSTGASTGAATSSSTSTSDTATTGAVTTVPTGTTAVDPTTVDPATTASTTTSTSETSSGTTGPDCGGCQVPTPVCDPATLDCVECLTDDQCPGGTEPVCDPDSHTCRGCLAHGECDLACERDLGSCFPPDAAVLEVSTELVCPGTACIDEPCCSLSDALKKASQLPNQYVVIRMSHGTADIDTTPVSVSELTGDDRRIAVLGPPSLARIEANIAGPLISLERLEAIDAPLKTKLYLSHLRVSAGGGVRCLRATRLWIDDSTLIANSGGSGLQVHDCAANAERTMIVGNAGGVEAHDGAVVGLASTIVGGSSSQPELLVDSGSTLFGVYVTVADQPAVDGSLIQCMGAVDVTLRNSIFVAGQSMLNPVACDTPLHLNWTAVSPPGLVTKGESNLPIADPKTELPFKNWDGHDFLIDPDKPPGQIVAAAFWLDGDPKTDINGTPRANMHESPDFAGADKP